MTREDMRLAIWVAAFAAESVRQGPKTYGYALDAYDCLGVANKAVARFDALPDDQLPEGIDAEAKAG